MKSNSFLNPKFKLSSFPKRISSNANNAIDKIIQEKPKTINDNNNHNISDIQSSEKQTLNELINVAKDKIVGINNNEAKKENEFSENEINVKYLAEREISADEEAKLRSALTNHFIFQDLNEEIR